MSRSSVANKRKRPHRPRSVVRPPAPARVPEEEAKIWFDLMCVPVIEGWREEAPICWRHWGPAAALKYNGGGMMVLLGKEWLRELAPKGSFSQATRERQWKQSGNICCLLGDVRMFELWQQVAPGAPPAAILEATRP